jgi:hypothetical protein
MLELIMPTNKLEVVDVRSEDGDIAGGHGLDGGGPGGVGGVEVMGLGGAEAHEEKKHGQTGGKSHGDDDGV